ncbi:MAG: hypothetical protein HY006_01230 [Candidatus Sungbacteria bacterium]|nr:hypothetical protein [Candidatus Sungbacteria bacterium]
MSTYGFPVVVKQVGGVMRRAIRLKGSQDFVSTYFEDWVSSDRFAELYRAIIGQLDSPGEDKAQQDEWWQSALIFVYPCVLMLAQELVDAAEPMYGPQPILPTITRAAVMAVELEIEELGAQEFARRTLEYIYHERPILFRLVVEFTARQFELDPNEAEAFMDAGVGFAPAYVLGLFRKEVEYQSFEY